MRAPTSNPITQGAHGTSKAVDYSARPDPNIYAPEDGRVVSYGYVGDCGNNLRVRSGSRLHSFCHLERPTVSVGQNVKKGQVIGIMGYTGYTIPAGPGGRHLHWWVKQGSTYYYPPSLINEPFNTPQGGSEVANRNQVNNIYKAVLHRNGDEGGLRNYTGKDANFIVSDMLKSKEWLNHNHIAVVAYPEAVRSVNQLQGRIVDLTNQVNNLNKRPTEAQINTLKAAIKAAQEQATKDADELRKQLDEAKKNQGGLDKETKDTIKETNAIVKLIKNILERVFK